jgi:hypothetical protein
MGLIGLYTHEPWAIQLYIKNANFHCTIENWQKRTGSLRPGDVLNRLLDELRRLHHFGLQAT